MDKLKKLAIPIFLLFGVVYATSSNLYSFQEGCVAYAMGDWDSAVILLKKATSYKENQNADAYYMLITSEIYSNDYSGALDDCDFFLNNFPSSILKSKVCYLKGRILYNLGEYEKSILVLSDFCHEYEDDSLYSQALFYIGESLYSAYKYDEAKNVYESIISDYPDSSKVSAAQYRLDSILQRSREEKLLYLFKQTGEEYLSAKEDYEKQLKMYNSDSVNSTRQKLSEAQKKNQELEQKIIELENQLSQIHSDLNQKNESQKNAFSSENLQNENHSTEETQTENNPNIQDFEFAFENNSTEEKEDSITVRQLKLKAELLKMMMEDVKSEEENN